MAFSYIAVTMPNSVSISKSYDLPDGFTKDNCFVCGIRLLRENGTWIYSNDGLMCNVIITTDNKFEINATKDGVTYCSGQSIGVLFTRLISA